MLTVVDAGGPAEVASTFLTTIEETLRTEME